jgi:hypothetical protein
MVCDGKIWNCENAQHRETCTVAEKQEEYTAPFTLSPTSAPSKLVAVNTAFENIVPLNELPMNDALSTMAFVKSALSKFESLRYPFEN